MTNMNPPPLRLAGAVGRAGHEGMQQVRKPGAAWLRLHLLVAAGRAAGVDAEMSGLYRRLYRDGDRAGSYNFRRGGRSGVYHDALRIDFGIFYHWRRFQILDMVGKARRSEIC